VGEKDCLFCRIGRKEIPAKLVYEDPEIFAFEDINPQAPEHILICPRKHLVSLREAEAADAALLGRILLVGAQLAKARKSARAFSICTCTCSAAARWAGRPASVRRIASARTVQIICASS